MDRTDRAVGQGGMRPLSSTLLSHCQSLCPLTAWWFTHLAARAHSTSSDPPGDNTMAYQLWCVGGRIRCVSGLLGRALHIERDGQMGMAGMSLMSHVSYVSSVVSSLSNHGARFIA